MIPLSSRNHPQRKIRGQVQQQDVDLIGRHAAIVDGVELLDRNAKPSGMQTMQRIVLYIDCLEPKHQNAGIDAEIPQEIAA